MNNTQTEAEVTLEELDVMLVHAQKFLRDNLPHEAVARAREILTKLEREKLFGDDYHQRKILAETLIAQASGLSQTFA